jgi:hypothetical protein
LAARVSLGTVRLLVGQPCEVRRVQAGAGGKIVERWEPAVFSHYDAKGRPVIQNPRDATEKLDSIEDVRPCS